MTAQRGLFAAGDVVSGPTTVIEAIASGHEAAASINCYLETGTPGRKHPAGVSATELGLRDPDPVEAAQIRSTVQGIEPGREFAEVEQPYTAVEAVAEASRCLRCGPCHECVVCVPGCDRRHLFMHIETVEAPTTWLPLRVTSDFAARLGTNGALPAKLVGSSTSAETDLDLWPMRMRYSADLCRGCARCIEVCSFNAFDRDSAVAPDAPVRFDPAACRGCALCSAVCPTGALTPVAHSPEWWEMLEPAGNPSPTHLTLVCDTGAPTAAPAGNGDMIACRCVGQAHPGMLLDLFRKGTEQITVVPCAQCRFGTGTQLAAQHVAESVALLRALGQNGSSVRLATPSMEGA
jgi:ferredoxin